MSVTPSATALHDHPIDTWLPSVPDYVRPETSGRTDWSVEHERVKVVEPSGVRTNAPDKEAPLIGLDEWVWGLLQNLQSEKAIPYLEGFLKTLAEWVEEYGAEADDIADAMIFPKEQNSGTTNSILLSYYRYLSFRSGRMRVPFIETEDAKKIGQIAAQHVRDASNLIALSGPVLDRNVARETLNIEYEELDKLRDQQGILHYKAFEKEWYPLWQFDSANGKIYSVISSILQKFGPDVEIKEVLSWSKMRFQELNRLNPFEWIKANGDQHKLLETIGHHSHSPPSVRRMRSELATVYPESETPSNEPAEPSAGPVDIFTTEIPSAFARLSTSRAALLILSGTVRNIDEIVLEILEQIDQLEYVGTTAAFMHVVLYFQHVSFLSDISKNQLTTELDEEAVRWLGEQAGVFTTMTTKRLDVIGPRLSREEVRSLLQTDSQSIDELLAEGNMISVPALGGDWFPVWQFDLEGRSLNPVAMDTVSSLKTKEGYRVPSYTIAGWAMGKQVYIDNHMPSEWIANHRDTSKLRNAASKLVYDYFYR